MATKRKQNPDEVVHVQVKPGAVVRFNGIAYGDRSTLQVAGRDLDRVDGDYELLDSGADAHDVSAIDPN